MRVQQLMQASLPRVAKWSMAKIMSKRYSFDKIAVEAKGGTDITCDTRDELDMKSTSGQIVIAAKAENLRLAVQAIISRKMDDLLDIAHERWPKDGRGVLRARKTTNDIAIVAAIWIDPAARAIFLHTVKQTIAERLWHRLKTGMQALCRITHEPSLRPAHHRISKNRWAGFKHYEDRGKRRDKKGKKGRMTSRTRAAIHAKQQARDT